MERHWFLSRLECFAGSDAVVYEGEVYDYVHLLRSVDDWRTRLDSEGISTGQVVALESELSPEACACLLALIERGVIVVPLTEMPPAKHDEFCDIAQVETMIEVGSSEGRHRCRPTQVRADRDLYNRLREEGHPGLVLFSSGSSGRSKASVLDFDKVLGRYGDTRPSATRMLSFLNLDHIGGINTVLHTLSQGGAIITVPDRTPDSVFAVIAEYRGEVLPTTPTFLNMVLISGAYERHDTGPLKMITYGTEPMPLQTLHALKAALPHVRLKQTYGLSELGILPTKSKSDDSLWVKLGGAGFEHKIVDDILWIRSDMAMLGYLNAPSPFDEEGFFNTQDMVQAEGEWVCILGRDSEIINVGGEKVYPNEVENVLLEVPNVADATVSGHPNPVTGMVVKAKVKAVHHEEEKALERRARAHCEQRLERFKVPMVIEVSKARQHSDRFKKVRRPT